MLSLVLWRFEDARVMWGGVLSMSYRSIKRGVGCEEGFLISMISGFIVVALCIDRLLAGGKHQKRGL